MMQRANKRRADAMQRVGRRKVQVVRADRWRLDERQGCRQRQRQPLELDRSVREVEVQVQGQRAKGKGQN